jgi:hypothetical protein
MGAEFYRLPADRCLLDEDDKERQHIEDETAAGEMDWQQYKSPRPY